jgi:pyruvate formate lyase activating enzyme
MLLKHYKIAKEIGLNFVYVGNVQGNPYEHTYCPECKSAVIKRHGFIITGWNLDDKHNCKNCGYRIPITGQRARYFTSRDIEAFYIPKIRRIS